MAYNSRKTNPYGAERHFSNGMVGPGDGKKEDKPRKATPIEKAYLKESMRAVKGKAPKNTQMADRIAAGTGPIGVSDANVHSKSGVKSYNKAMDAKKAALETSYGQKVVKAEQKQMKKNPNYGQPRFQVTGMAHRTFNPDAGKIIYEDKYVRKSTKGTLIKEASRHKPGR